MERYPALAARVTAEAESEPIGRSRWTFWLIGLGILSLAGSVAIAAYNYPPTTVPTPAPTSPPNTRRAVAVAYVDVEGGVRPLYPAVPGRVVQAPVPEGKEVEQGTLLIQIDDALAQARLAEAKVDLQAAQERLVQAKKKIAQQTTGIAMQKSAIEAARRKLEAAQAQATKVKRIANLQGGPEDLEAANKLVAEAQARVRVEESRLHLVELIDPESEVRLAQFDVAAKTEQVEKASLGVRECRILAPCKGVVLRRLVNVGEVIGQSPNRPAVEFCPSGDRIVRAEVEQEFAGKLFVGQKATIADDITGQGEWHGEVLRISDWYTQRRAVLLEPMQYNDIRTLEVVLRLVPDAKNPLRINQRVRVRLDGAQ